MFLFSSIPRKSLTTNIHICSQHFDHRCLYDFQLCHVAEATSSRGKSQRHQGERKPATMGKRKLTDLPNELLTQILSYIHGQSHLGKIALLSKQFKGLVDCLLYRHISLDIQYSANDFRNIELSIDIPTEQSRASVVSIDSSTIFPYIHALTGKMF